jgi:hypothetical protein
MLPISSTVDGQVVVSDSLPAVHFAARLSRCPEEALLGRMELRCSLNRTTLDSAVTDVAVTYSPQDGGFDLRYYCSSSSSRVFEATSVSLDVTVSVLPLFGVSSTRADLTCALYAGLSTAPFVSTTIPLAVQGTNWPVATDAVHFVPGTNSVNATSLVRGAASLQSCGRVPTFPNVSFGHCVLDAVVAADQGGAWAASLPPRIPLPTFALNVTSTTLILLRAMFPGSFSDASRATVGGRDCIIIGASIDGQWLALFLPNASTMCQDPASGLCTFNVFDVSTQESCSANDSGDVTCRRAATITCPPLCPGDLERLSGALDTAIVPYAPNRRGAGYLLANESLVEVGFTPPWLNLNALRHPNAVLAPGIHYSFSCTALGFTDPASGACTSATDPASFRCALNDACGECPSQVLCPGGGRKWPRPGYFAFTETDSDTQVCDERDGSERRCMGWDPASGSTVCGAAYRQGSYLCEACAASCYAVGDGTCKFCPIGLSAWQSYRGLLLIIIGLAGCVPFVYGVLVAIVRRYGGTITSTASYAMQLGAWAIFTLQSAAQVASVSSDSMPPLIAGMFGTVSKRSVLTFPVRTCSRSHACCPPSFVQLSALNLNGIVLPPQCSGIYPFTPQMSTMGALVACTGTVAMCALLPRLFPRLKTLAKSFDAVGRVALTFALVALAPATTGAAALLHCVPANLGPIALKVLDGGSSVSVGSSGTATVQILARDSFFVCWAGTHVGAATFAIFTLLIAVAAGPIGLYFLVRRDAWLLMRLTATQRRRSCPARTLLCFQREHIDLDDEDLKAVADSPALLLAPVLSDFRPTAWYAKFSEISFTLLLSLLRAMQPPRVTLTYGITQASVISGSVIVLSLFILVIRPYRADRAWMGHVRIVLLAIAACCAIMNAVTSAIDLGVLETGPRMEAALRAAAVLLVLFLCGALLLLVWGVGRAMISYASAEQAQIIESRRRWTSSASATSSPLRVLPKASGVSGRHQRPSVSAIPGRLQRPSVIAILGRRPPLRESVLHRPHPQEHDAEIRMQTSALFEKNSRRMARRALDIEQLDSAAVTISNPLHVADVMTGGASARFMLMQNPLRLAETRRAKIGAVRSPSQRQQRLRARPAVAIACLGCEDCVCPVCTSAASLRFSSALRELADAMGTRPQRPLVALARCQLLREVLQDSDSSLPRNALCGAVPSLAEMLREFSAQSGVIDATCHALCLVMRRISAFDVVIDAPPPFSGSASSAQALSDSALHDVACSDDVTFLNQTLQHLVGFTTTIDNGTTPHVLTAIAAACAAVTTLARREGNALNGRPETDASQDIHTPSFAAVGITGTLLAVIRACAAQVSPGAEAALDGLARAPVASHCRHPAHALTALDQVCI